MEWIGAPRCWVEVEPDDTTWTGSPPHAVILRNIAKPGHHSLGVEGTADELRELAARFTAAVAGLD